MGKVISNNDKNEFHIPRHYYHWRTPLHSQNLIKTLEECRQHLGGFIHQEIAGISRVVPTKFAYHKINRLNINPLPCNYLKVISGLPLDSLSTAVARNYSLASSDRSAAVSSFIIVISHCFSSGTTRGGAIDSGNWFNDPRRHLVEISWWSSGDLKVLLLLLNSQHLTLYHPLTLLQLFFSVWWSQYSAIHGFIQSSRQDGEDGNVVPTRGRQSINLFILTLLRLLNDRQEVHNIVHLITTDADHFLGGHQSALVYHRVV